MRKKRQNYKRWAMLGQYAPTSVRDQKIRALTDHVLDWVWVHPGYEFNIAYRYYMDGSISPVFSMHAFYRDQLVRYIPAEGDPNWSVQQPCTEDNLRTLLAVLRRIDLEAGKDE